jgi:tRNA A-37 threonylcarbamoyl transferase component Bud32
MMTTTARPVARPVPPCGPIVPGARIDAYTIERKLKEGGMAEVYLAHCNVNGSERRVVIKSVLPAYVDQQEFVVMMRNEARLAARLDHPNIVRVENLVEVGGRPYLVMEYLDGPTLRELVHRAVLRDRALPLSVVCGIAIRILAGLGHAHDCADAAGQPLGLVHRDVSLSNVIVTWPGAVKLIDFGVAKATLLNQDLTRAGHVKGKSAYMSPEQVRLEKLDRRSDLFSVGIVLWEMLTQRRLFARRLEVDSMMAVCCHSAPPPSALAPELPPGLDRICARALERDRAQRYQTASEMRRDLEALMAAEGWRGTHGELQAELASLFADDFEEVGSAAAARATEVRAPMVVTVAMSHGPVECLYGDTADAEGGPDAAVAQPAVARFESRAATRTAATPPPEISMLNRPMPAPSVYDDWYGPEPRRGRSAMWLCWLLLSGCLLVAMALLLQRFLVTGALP